MAVVVISSCLRQDDKANKETVEQKAERIHDKVLTIDTHCDTPMRLVRGGFDIGKWDKEDKGGRVDFVRMKEGGLDAMFFAVFTGQKERTEEGNLKVKTFALEILDSIKAAVGRYPDIANLAYEPDDAYENEKQGKRSIYIGMENGYPVGKDLANVELFYNLGVRYITLCHSSNNDICDSSTDKGGPEYNGLSSFGEEVVKEMNRLGMLIDVSHISDSSFYDVIRLSEDPVIASHSCSRAMCDHPRNLSDDMLLALAKNGGVIQMCFVDEYIKPNAAKDSAEYELGRKYPEGYELSEEESKALREEWNAIQERYAGSDVKDVVDHIDHIVEVAGIDHVGIGTDFDGGGGVIGCQDVSQMGNITLELVKRGYSEEAIEKIWGGNFMRVFRRVRD